MFLVFSFFRTQNCLKANKVYIYVRGRPMRERGSPSRRGVGRDGPGDFFFFFFFFLEIFIVEPEPLLPAGPSLTREPREVVKTKQRRKKKERKKSTHTGENEIENFFGEKRKRTKNPQACAISLAQCPLINIYVSTSFSFSFLFSSIFFAFFTFFSEEKDERNFKKRHQGKS